MAENNADLMAGRYFKWEISAVKNKKEENLKLAFFASNMKEANAS